MGVMRERYSEWPETVAFKRMLRSLTRGQQYVPPQQPEGTPPDPEASAATISADESASPASLVPLVDSDWALGQNSQGDVVLTHRTGHEVTLARNPEGGQ